MLLPLLELVFIFIFLLLGITQVIVPLAKNEPLFPYFRSVAPLKTDETVTPDNDVEVGLTAAQIRRAELNKVKEDIAARNRARMEALRNRTEETNRLQDEINKL